MTDDCQERAIREPDWEAIRSLIPASRRCHYFNTGTLAPGVVPVIERTHAAYREWMESWPGLPMAYYGARQAAETTRAHLARILRLSPDEIALLGSSTDAMNLVASGIAWCPGDEVVITDQEHQAGVFPWLRLQQEGRLRLRRVALSQHDDETMAAFERVVTSRTRLVAISHVSCESGIRLPVERVARLARAHSAELLLDGSQTFGQMPLDLSQYDFDYYALTGHKWTLGPVGTGGLVIRRDRLEAFAPAWVGDGSGDVRLSEMGEVLVYHPSARRFECGTRDWTKFVGWDASLAFIEEIGIEALWARSRRLADRLVEALADVPGVEIVSALRFPQATGLVSFRVGAWEADPLMETLWRCWRIAARAVPHLHAVRVSVAFFNTESDIDVLVAAVRSLASSRAAPP